MTCVEFQRKLSAYADGELSRWTRWKVQQHLGHCPDCAGLLQEFDEIDTALCTCLGAEPAPGYLTDAVIRRLPAMPPPWRRPATVVRWATAGALAGAQLLAVYGAYWWGFAARGSVPGARGGLTAPVGALRESPSRRTAGDRSEGFTSPGVWGRRDARFPLALPEPVTRPGPSNRTSDLQPVGVH